MKHRGAYSILVNELEENLEVMARGYEETKQENENYLLLPELKESQEKHLAVLKRMGFIKTYEKGEDDDDYFVYWVYVDKSKLDEFYALSDAKRKAIFNNLEMKLK